MQGMHRRIRRLKLNRSSEWDELEELRKKIEKEWGLVAYKSHATSREPLEKIDQSSVPYPFDVIDPP